MPTYDYKCEACGHEMEAFQSMSAAPLKKCPECGKNKLKRLIGIGAGVIFKGSGFYETDYRGDSYNKAAKSEKESGKSESKSEKKTEAKSESKKTETKAKPDGGAKKNDSKTSAA